MASNDELLAAIGGVQITIAGISIGILFDFGSIVGALSLLSVIVGTYVVARQLWKARRNRSVGAAADTA